MELNTMLQDLADWGGYEVSDFKKQFGEGTYTLIRRRSYAEVIDLTTSQNS